MTSRNLTPRSRAGFGLDPLLDLHREMNRLFDDAFTGGQPAELRGTGMTAPRLDVHEKDGELCIIAELPGVTQQDLDLQIEGDMLTIRGERKSETEQERANYYIMERNYGRFQRTVQLPFSPNPDEVKASFENGLLTIRMPNAGSQRAHRIELSGSADQKRSPQIAGKGQGKGGGEQHH